MANSFAQAIMGAKEKRLSELRIKFPYSQNCAELQKTIDKLINEKSFYNLKLDTAKVNDLNDRLKELNASFVNLNCEMVIGDRNLEKVSEIALKYQEADKARIQLESKTERNKRIYIGIAIILTGVGLILITNRK